MKRCILGFFECDNCMLCKKYREKSDKNKNIDKRGRI